MVLTLENWATWAGPGVDSIEDPWLFVVKVS